MTGPPIAERRTVLKALGAVVAGGVAAATPASADELESNGQIPVFPTWGAHDIWEMVDAEPPTRDRMQDAEGDCSAHSPLYLIASMEETGVAGSSHSPHFAGLDQVIAVPGGPASDQFSAQWHPKVVVGEGGITNKDQNGNYLTSATAIQNATNVTVVPLPEVTVFTCPARPH